jgi:hypothetical protein
VGARVNTAVRARPRHNNVSPVTGLRYARVYPGDAEDKRVAQLFTYRHALEAPRVGAAVTLSGTSPLAEVLLMRDYLQWPGERTYFIDWAKDAGAKPLVLAGFKAIRREWPGANVEHGDINDVVTRLPMIGFANLDFMGFDRTSVMPCVQKTIEHLARGGVISLTWFRGREVDEPNRSAWDVFEAARDVEDLDSRRRVGIQRLIHRWARAVNVTLEWMGGLDYQHKHSPMSVMVWRRKRT